MSSLGYGRVFADPEILKDMLNAYANGASSSQLARIYHCDHTSILYQARKASIIQTFVTKVGYVPSESKLERRFRLRRFMSQSFASGLLVSDIAPLIGITKESIYGHLRADLELKKIYDEAEALRAKKKQSKYEFILDDEARVNAGKSYAVYLNEYKKKINPMRRERMAKVKKEKEARKNRLSTTNYDVDEFYDII